MKVEIIAVGTELLLGQIVNTNAQWLSQRCAELGFSVHNQQVVGDNMMRLVEAINIALQRADIVVCTGGLGPTEDDISRHALAQALQLELKTDMRTLEWLENRFKHFGRKMTENNKRQALVPNGGEMLPNSRGTAPGIWLDSDEKHIVLLPGPPNEMKEMFVKKVTPKLVVNRDQVKPIVSRSLRCIGIGESSCATILGDLIDRQTTPTIALYAHAGEIEVRLTAQGTNKAEALQLIHPVETLIRDRLDEHVYGVDEDQLHTVVAELLIKNKKTIAVAESCTGGLLAHNLTRVSGSSSFFKRGLVTYSNTSKQELLDVEKTTIDKYGAVSEECAHEMAQGLLGSADVDLVVAITGIAGPLGGTNEKPVGTVYIAFGDKHSVKVQRFHMHGDRQGIQLRTVKHSLNLIRLFLQEL